MIHWLGKIPRVSAGKTRNYSNYPCPHKVLMAFFIVYSRQNKLKTKKIEKTPYFLAYFACFPD